MSYLPKRKYILVWVLLFMAVVAAWRPLPDLCPVPAADSAATDIRYDSEHIRYPMFAAMRHVLTLGQQPACFGQLQAMQQTIPGDGWTAAVAAVLQQQALGLFAGWVRMIYRFWLAWAALLMFPDLKHTLIQYWQHRKIKEKP